MTESQVTDQSNAPTTQSAATTARKTGRMIWIAASTLDALLGFRVLLKLVGANPAAPFTELIYSLSAPLVSPFRNLVGNPAFGRGVLEITTLFGMLVYMFLSWLLIELWNVLLSR